MSSKPRVIAIATNASPELDGKRTGLWLSELTHFLHVIEEAGLEYDLVSPNGGAVPLDEKSATDKERKDPANASFIASGGLEKLERTLAAKDVDPSGYVGLYLAGGHGTMYDFQQSPALGKLVSDTYAAGKLVSGVCHGVSGLLGAVDAEGRPLVRGRRVTGFSNVEDQLAGVKSLLPYLLEDALEQQGAEYRKNLVPFTERVEVDGRLITGQNPQSAKGVAERFVAALRA